MNEYKGIYYNDDAQEQKFYEGGAHFKYSELCKRLELLITKIPNRLQSAQSSRVILNIYNIRLEIINRIYLKRTQKVFIRIKQSRTFLIIKCVNMFLIDIRIFQLTQIIIVKFHKEICFRAHYQKSKTKTTNQQSDIYQSQNIQ